MSSSSKYIKIMKKILKSIFSRLKPALQTGWNSLKSSGNLGRWGNQAVDWALNRAMNSIKNNIKPQHHRLVD